MWFFEIVFLAGAFGLGSAGIIGGLLPKIGGETKAIGLLFVSALLSFGVSTQVEKIPLPDFSSSSSSSGKMLENGEIPGFKQCLKTETWSDDANENIRYCCKQVRGTLRDGVLYKTCEKKSRK